MAASHSGEDRHVRTVQALLRAGGLTREVLACGTHRPFDRETAERLIRDGEPPSPLRHNCSGKHAGMALHAKAAGWPVETYWQPDHPVQQLALDTVAALTDVPRDKIALATDGCGVVTFGIPLRGLALGFARLADPSGVADADAARGAGADSRRDDGPSRAGRRRAATASTPTLMRAAPGDLVSKGGAEGVQAVAILAGEPRGLAIKVEDGDAVHRARSASTVAALPSAWSAGPAGHRRASGRVRGATHPRPTWSAVGRGAAGLHAGLSQWCATWPWATPTPSAPASSPTRLAAAAGLDWPTSSST